MKAACYNKRRGTDFLSRKESIVMEQKNKSENGKKEIYQTKLFWIGLVLAGLAAGFLVGLFLL